MSDIKRPDWRSYEEFLEEYSKTQAGKVADEVWKQAEALTGTDHPKSKRKQVKRSIYELKSELERLNNFKSQSHGFSFHRSRLRNLILQMETNGETHIWRTERF